MATVSKKTFVSVIAVSFVIGLAVGGGIMGGMSLTKSANANSDVNIKAAAEKCETKPIKDRIACYKGQGIIDHRTQ